MDTDSVAIRGHIGPHRRWGGAKYAVVVAKDDARGLLAIDPPRTNHGLKAAVFNEVELAVETWPDAGIIQALLEEIPKADRIVLTMQSSDLADDCIRDLEQVLKLDESLI